MQSHDIGIKKHVSQYVARKRVANDGGQIGGMKADSDTVSSNTARGQTFFFDD